MIVSIPRAATASWEDRGCGPLWHRPEEPKDGLAGQQQDAERPEEEVGRREVWVRAHDIPTPLRPRRAFGVAAVGAGALLGGATGVVGVGDDLVVVVGGGRQTRAPWWLVARMLVCMPALGGTMEEPVEMKVMNILDSPPANPLMSCGGGGAQIIR